MKISSRKKKLTSFAKLSSDKKQSSIRNKLDGSDTYKEEVSSVDFEKGDSVFIKEGRLAGLEAIFLSKKSKDRVRLLLKLLNTSVVTEIIESNIGHKEITKNFKF